MSEPKKFSRGKHSYTKWGHNFKEVRVQGGKKDGADQPAPESIIMDVDAAVEPGVFSNIAGIHRSDEEVIIDFAFLPPGKKRGRVAARVVLPLPHVHALAKALAGISAELKKRK